MLTEKEKDAHAPALASSHGAPISIEGAIAYFEGDYVPLIDAKVSIMTHAFMYGTAVFEGIRAYWNAEQGVLYGLKLREHMERIRRNAGMLLMGDLPPVDELVLKHGELVKRIAYHVVSRLPSHIEVDDLIQAGMIGLLNAAKNFTPTKGANFETYAGIRIRGAMLDEARRSN